MRTLLTWSDRPTLRTPTHHGPRPSSDRGPILRLLEHADEPYDALRLLCTPSNREPSERHLVELRRHVAGASLHELAVADPSDYAQLFHALPAALARLDGDCDVLLSAGTPQMQTLWVILVEAGLLPARMLQVIPAAFVPDPHPHPIREVRLDIEGFPEIRAMREELIRLRAESRVRGSGGKRIGNSEPMRLLERRLARVARTNVPVLIFGETGTGKELIARALHDASERAEKPFVAENCGSFSEGVLASELFGHERGAFTGAAARRRGLFEQAHGGTLFLDEIAETSARVQVMLLRVLQEGRLRRVGGEQEIGVDVRVVAATHRDLRAMVRAGEFREDLYYRLCGATLELPPLRERGRDLELLVASFLAELGRTREPWPDEAAWAALHRYPWPGNVRELRAEVIRWSVFCERVVGLEDLSPEIRGTPPDAGPAPISPPPAPGPDEQLRPLADQLAETEARAIRAALAACQGNLSATARALAIDRNTLKRKLARLGLR